MKLLVGLGNPTPRYEVTRHNAGFLCIDAIAAAHGLAWTAKKKLRALQAQGDVLGVRCLLLKPQTWMNHSGQAVAAAMSFFRIASTDIVVVYDDLDVPAGRVKCKAAGGAGGHNGVQSIIDCLHTQDFQRIKLGVARPAGAPQSGEEWVLGRFTAAELEVLRTEMYEQVMLRLQQIFAKQQA